MKTTPSRFPGFRPVPKTGVIFVSTEAGRRGFTRGDPAWANLGQGAPEIGALEGGPARVDHIDLREPEHEYGPVPGLDDLRQAVADLYNHRYRQGLRSQYTRDNVAICAGGRLALTRLVSTLGRTHVGHFLPDYTAYEELLSSFGSFVPIPILLDPDKDYAFSAEDLEKEILGLGLSVVLLSNPCNPTGKLIHGEEMDRWVDTCRRTRTTLILDEFYSHYVYGQGAGTTASAARHVVDVDEDPVVLLDGLTKNWRYPGWRVSWTVGPRDIIDSVSSAGSFLDGGCSHPMQRAAMPLLDPPLADQEAAAIQAAFEPKRELMLRGLRKLGIKVPHEPGGAFYCWGDVSGLPDGMATGMEFFRKVLDEKVIVVPGSFFDINPGGRRPERPSRFRRYVRFSYGPTGEELARGLDGIARAIERAG